MNVHTFYPENALLKKHVAYYYFLKTESADFHSSYYAFPNIQQAFNIHKGASCAITSHAIRVQADLKNNYLLIAQGKHEIPLYVQLKGILDKVTVIFKPLGFNHFIQSPLLAVTPQVSQVFTEWNSDENCHKFLHAFYSTQDNSQRVKLLEVYLLSRYKPLPEYAVLQPVLEKLINFDQECSVEEIITRSGMNPRTFNRLFYKHLVITPVAFRKIARFRHSLQNKLFSNQFKMLTEIGYESNFYDQSYFTKMYKKITGDNPSRFFSSIQQLANDQLILKFIQE